MSNPRAEFMAGLIEQGMRLGGAMAIADAAGKLSGYNITVEQASAIFAALSESRHALRDRSVDRCALASLAIAAAVDAIYEEPSAIHGGCGNAAAAAEHSGFTA